MFPRLGDAPPFGLNQASPARFSGVAWDIDSNVAYSSGREAFHKGIPAPRTTPHAVRCGLGGRRLVGYLTARPPHRGRFPTQGAPLRSDPGLWSVTPSAYSAARPTCTGTRTRGERGLWSVTPSAYSAARPTCSRARVPGVLDEGGGHGTRTRNPLRGTSFPMRPLAIRLPSGRAMRPGKRLLSGFA